MRSGPISVVVFVAIFTLGANVGCYVTLLLEARRGGPTAACSCECAPAPAELEIACPQLGEHVERLESAEGFRERVRETMGRVR